MRLYIIVVWIVAFNSIVSYGFCQGHSNLYLKVDSIIRYQLRFNIDSAKRVDSVFASKGMHVSSNYPIILLNGEIISLHELERYTLEEVNIEKVVTRLKWESVPIYTEKIVYGIIIIKKK